MTGLSTKPAPAARMAIACFRVPIHLYRWFVSPFTGGTCRHLPTCSQYALEAIGRHGPWRGGWLTLSRLVRCNPWGSHGYDPVPDELPERHGPLHAWRYGRWTGKHIVHRFHDESAGRSGRA